MIESIIIMLLCLPSKQPPRKFKIKPKMITPNVVRVDMKSLRAYMETEEGKSKSGVKQ